MAVNQAQLQSINGAIGGLYTLFCNDPNKSLTGTVAETELFRQIVPANLIGVSGALVVVPLFSNNNSVGNKTLRIKFGGTTFSEATNTANLTCQIFKFITNTALNAQISSALSALGFGAAAGDHVIGAIDTTIDQYVTITGQLANALDTMTLEATYIGVIPWSQH